MGACEPVPFQLYLFRPDGSAPALLQEHSLQNMPDVLAFLPNDSSLAFVFGSKLRIHSLR